MVDDGGLFSVVLSAGSRDVAGVVGVMVDIVEVSMEEASSVVGATVAEGF